MKARDIMTKTVRTAAPKTSVRDLARLMVRHRVSAIPVVERGQRLLGIVSEGDLLRRRETGTLRRRPNWLDFFVDPGSKAREFVKSHARHAADVMTRPVVSVTADTDLADIADLLERRHIKRVPVVKGGRLVGIVSRHDLVGALARSGSKTATKPRRGTATDRQIRDTFDREIRRRPWTDAAVVNATVHRGVVELYGLVNDESRRAALRALAENIPGVRSVKDKLAVGPVQFYGM
jgi:CBS-domain-containing membrane protein